MKNRGMWIILALVLSLLVCAVPFCLSQFAFGKSIYDSVFEDSASGLPILKAGRVMPLSSASADVLKSISGKVGAKLDGKRISSMQWLMLLSGKPHTMSYRPFLRTDNKDLQKLFGTDDRYFSYDSIGKNYDALYKSATSGEKTPYAEACASALNAGVTYAMSSDALAMRLDEAGASADSADLWRKSVAAAAEEIETARKENRKPDESKLRAASAYLGRIKSAAEFDEAYSNSALRAIPSGASFKTSAEVMLERTPDPVSSEVAALYAKLSDSVSSDDENAARENLVQIYSKLRTLKNIDFLKLRIENITNAIDPFFCGFVLYALCCACFLAGAAFKKISSPLDCMGAIFLLVAAIIHIGAICARMYIQSRPPVTNLYSSIVFTGAIAAALGWFMYARKGLLVFAVSGAVAGLLSLLLAMNLPYGGDTMGMMRAVLNSNFWLTIHVVTIMIGYCGVFLAGFVAEFRFIANIFERNRMNALTSQAASGVYGILCFALVFSFAGTMLGGIWADMSWGRFWGWDPKENGALMIVLWCAAAIHGRIMGLLGDKSFLAFAIFGNIIAAWAWFGVNLMGVGLHAYGFIDGGWAWFFAFVISQLALIPLAFLKEKSV